MTTAPVTLALLARRFETLADMQQGRNATRTRKNAAQLRAVAALTVNGTMSVTDAWSWADAAAGQLISDTRQIDKKARAR